MKKGYYSKKKKQKTKSAGYHGETKMIESKPSKSYEWNNRERTQEPEKGKKKNKETNNTVTSEKKSQLRMTKTLKCLNT